MATATNSATSSQTIAAVAAVEPAALAHDNGAAAAALPAIHAASSAAMANANADVVQLLAPLQLLPTPPNPILVVPVPPSGGAVAVHAVTPAPDANASPFALPAAGNDGAAAAAAAATPAPDANVTPFALPAAGGANNAAAAAAPQMSPFMLPAASTSTDQQK